MRAPIFVFIRLTCKNPVSIWYYRISITLWRGDRALSKENKKLLQYLGITFTAVLLTYKLPHDSYSIIQYIIPPIKGEDSVIYLSGIVPLVLFIIGIKGLFRLERFADKNRLLMFLAVVLILIPAMKWTLDMSRTNYHWIKGDGLKAIDIQTSDISVRTSNDERVISMILELKDYSRKQNTFKIRVYFPKSLSAYIGSEFYDFESDYYTHGNRRISKIREEMTIKLNNGDEKSSLFDSKWYWEDVAYELYNSEEKVKIIKHGY